MEMLISRKELEEAIKERFGITEISFWHKGISSSDENIESCYTSIDYIKGTIKK